MKNSKKLISLITTLFFLTIPTTQIRVTANLKRDQNSKSEWHALVKWSEPQPGFKLTPENWRDVNLWTDKSNNRYIQFGINVNHVKKVKIHKVELDGALRGGLKWRFYESEVITKEVTDPNTNKVRFEKETIQSDFSKSQSRTFILHPHTFKDFQIDIFCDPNHKSKDDFDLDQSFGRIMFLVDSINLVSKKRERFMFGFDSLCSRDGIRTSDRSKVYLYLIILLMIFFLSKVNLDNPLNMIGNDGNTDRIDAFHISTFFGAGVTTIIISFTFWDFLLPVLKFTFSVTCFCAINLTLKKFIKWMFINPNQINRYRPVGNARGINPNRPAYVEDHFLMKRNPYLLDQKPIHFVTISLALFLIFEYFDTKDWLVPNIFLFTILYSIQFLYLPFTRTQYLFLTLTLYIVNILYSKRSMRIYNRYTLINSPLNIAFQIPKVRENWTGAFAQVGILNIAIAGLGIKGIRKRRLNKFAGLEGFVGVGAIAIGLLLSFWTDKTEWTSGTAETLGMMIGSVIVISVECLDKMLSGRGENTSYGGTGSSSNQSSRNNSFGGSFSRGLVGIGNGAPEFEIPSLNQSHGSVSSHSSRDKDDLNDYNNHELGFDRFSDSGGLNLSIDDSDDRLWV